MKLKIGIPKGSLQESTIRIFKKAGFNIIVSDRSYFPYIDDDKMEAVMFRAQEMSRYVEDGVIDCGITGNDWIMENNSKVVKVCDLAYAKQTLRPVRWVLAVPNKSNIKTINALKGKRVATELANVTRSYFKKEKIKADVEFSWGTTEAKTKMGIDAIVELTETGASLKANDLRIIATVCRSTTQFIANKNSWKNSWKRKKIEELTLLLKGAILAEDKVGLKMNVSQKNLKKVLSILPAMKKPTISCLSQKKWYDVDTIISESVVKRLIPKLKRAGAQGIIEYPLNKVIF
ncbi:MAG: ATP phosphoribosyltransferase [Candidatus Omnitrophica bacterium]|nr:ATP phosphoribosyltransferase [Candidatus Omnitrophota bacterium]